MRWSVLGTTDGGVTWNEQNHGGLDGNNVCVVDASTVWAVSDTTIQRTTNGGASWDQSTSPPDTLGISAVDSQQAWAVSRELNGTILHTSDGGTSWVELTELNGESLPGLRTVSFSNTAIPEPSSAALVVLGLAAMMGWRRQRA